MSVMAGHQKLTVTTWKQSSKLFLLKLLWGVAEELSVNHSMVIWHLKQIGKVKKLNKWVPYVQFSRSVVSYSLRPHEPQHIRPPFPSPTSRVYPNPCPLSRWCHPTISSSVVPSSPQSFPASGAFPMSWLFTSGGPSTEASTTASDLSMALGIDVLEAGSELVV